MDVSKMAVVVRMKADLRKAMKARQSVTVHTLRMMLSTLDNAGAVEVDTSHIPLAGVSPDVPQRELSEQQVMELLWAEADARRSALRHYEQLGKDKEAQRLQQELDVFARYLEEPPTE